MKDVRNLVKELPDLFGRDWALLTAGTLENCNTMTIGWGQIGTLWGLPVATVYVRPTRYTHDFIEKNDTFTISFYPPEKHKTLTYLGTHSGRDCDKIALSGLTPVAAGKSVTFKEAVLTVACKKIYRCQIAASDIPAEIYSSEYENGEIPHTLYTGQIIDLIDGPIQ